MSDQAGRLKEYVARLSDEDRAFMMAGYACVVSEPTPPKERKRKPAPPHQYRPCRITDQTGTVVCCSVRDCQDDRHRVRAALS